MSVKVTVNLSRPVVDTLKVMAAENGVSVTEMVRRSVSTQRWLHGVQQSGGRVLVQNPDGTTREVEFIR